MSSSPDSSVASAIRRQLGPAYDRFDREERVRHGALLQQIRKPGDLGLIRRREAPDRWSITIAASDGVGVLSVITGLMAAYRIEIWRGDVFSLKLESAAPRPRSPSARKDARRARQPPGRAVVSRRILDVFEVVAPHIKEDAFWDVFRSELAGLVKSVVEGDLERAREEITDRVSVALRETRQADERLLPVAISFDHQSVPNLTALHIVSTDAAGFLFALSNALAMLEINIVRVEIRTVGDEVRDTFWITDGRGRKLVAREKLDQLRLAATLIKQFTHLLPSAPNPSQALRQFGAMVSSVLADPALAADFDSLRSTEVLRTFAELLGVSRFLWEDFLRMQHGNLFPFVRDTSRLDRRQDKGALEGLIQGELARGGDDEAKARSVNRFRDREMFRIDLRHITGRTGDVQFSEELSDLTEVVVAEALQLCHAQLERRYGQPRIDQGKRCSWSVLAVGKFGGREMGFASDIELVFVYEGNGQTDGPSRIENVVYFEQLVQTCLRTLTARQEGIFQIDLRLRPYGKSGRLASALEQFRTYYSRHGSAVQFERMALVKLRPVVGDKALAADVLQARDRFVYSGDPVDYAGIRHLRKQQTSELVQRGTVNAKYSPGGLVDLEYFVQAQQIGQGAENEHLRVTNTMEALSRLKDGGYVDADVAGEIGNAYRCLRRVIDALRVVRGNAKDLAIPLPQSREFRYLSRRLGYETSGQLHRELDHSMAVGRRVWADLGSGPH